jgi:hypothetical protein
MLLTNFWKIYPDEEKPNFIKHIKIEKSFVFYGGDIQKSVLFKCVRLELSFRLFFKVFFTQKCIKIIFFYL